MPPLIEHSGTNDVPHAPRVVAVVARREDPVAVLVGGKPVPALYPARPAMAIGPKSHWRLATATGYWFSPTENCQTKVQYPLRQPAAILPSEGAENEHWQLTIDHWLLPLDEP